VQIEGSLDSSTHNEFLEKARELIMGGTRHMLLDLRQTAYVSSAGLKVINILFNQLRTIHPDSELSDADMKEGIAAGTYRSPHIKILGPTENIKATLHNTGFDMFLDIFTDMNEAIASF
jgi:anti-anti-sigma regulatory factor